MSSRSRDVSRAQAMGLLAVAYLAAASAAVATVRLLPPAHPLAQALAADIVATVIVFLFSVGLDNSSVYDPYWSVAPVALGAFWLAPGRDQGTSVRQVLVGALILAWASRLTLNCLRQWQGLQHEDWRYRQLREKLGAVYWPVSLLGIHLMPTLVVFAGCLPLYAALTVRSPFGVLDGVAVLVTGIAIGLEGTADRQMRRARTAAGPTATAQTAAAQTAAAQTAAAQTAAHDGGARPVHAPGLWAYSRHPNYLGEILFWWGLFLFGVAAAGPRWWLWVGPLAVTALFLLVSIPMMERHLLERPAYATYRQRTSRLLPWFRR